MQQLLQITVTPTRYELQIEHGRLEINQEFVPKSEINTTPGKMQVNSTPTTLRLDTYEARRSLGFKKIEDLIGDAADKGKASFQKYVRNSVEMGNQLGKIEEGVTIHQLFRQKLTETKGLYTAFLPSTGAQISWQPGNLDMNYSPASVNIDWQTDRPDMNYVPGSVNMNIIQYGDVQIEYIGGPLYVPPSADPNYKESSVE